MIKRTTFIICIIFLSFNLFGQQQLNRTLFFDGQNRSFIVYVPSSYDATTQVPLLFNFHGGGGTSSGFINYENDMRPIADTANFIAVYPQAAVDPTDGSNSWLHKTPTTHNDVNFIEAIIDTLSNDYNIDNDRVYACGYSEGGLFSYELGCRLNNRIASFASVSGSMLTESYRLNNGFGSCSPIHPTAVLLIPGTSDGSFHSMYNGFQPYYLSVNEITTYWANHNNTAINPTVTAVPNSNTSDGSTVEKRIWENGDNCVTVQELKVINGDHDWPGSSGNMDINASQEIWKFVSKYDINGLINCGSTDISTSKDLKFEIFPNPTSNIIYLNNLNKNSSNFQIFSSIGKLVMNGPINKTNISLDISNLKPQLYILKIDGISYKIIKE
jgi:polyhydroxybutyrate depolymerase